MGIIGGKLGYYALRRISRSARYGGLDGSTYRERSKLETLLGPGVWNELIDRVVVDFGCGTGEDAIEIARRGAKRVIGVDIQERFLTIARNKAAAAGLAERCAFTTHPKEPADVIISLDAFEHFEDCGAVLQAMHQMLARDGCVLISFGPPWHHPLGGHLFSVFPWAHLIFTEEALIRWRSDFKDDGATRFGEVAGGLNQMTIRRFQAIVKASPFRFDRFESVPIRRFACVANRFTREWTTAVVRCTLVPK